MDDNDGPTTRIATTAPPVGQSSGSQSQPQANVPPVTAYTAAPRRFATLDSSSSDGEGTSSSDEEDDAPQPPRSSNRRCGVNDYVDCTVPPPTKTPAVDYGRRFRVIDYDELARTEDAKLQALQTDLCSSERSTRAFQRDEHDAVATAASFLCSADGCDVLQPFFHDTLFVNPHGRVSADTYARIVELVVRLAERRILGENRGQWYAQPERAHVLAICHELPSVAAVIRAYGHTDPAAPSNGRVFTDRVSRLPLYLARACGQMFTAAEPLPYRGDISPARRFAATLLSVVYAGQLRADPPPRQCVAPPRCQRTPRQCAAPPRCQRTPRQCAAPSRPVVVPPTVVLSAVAVAQLDALSVPAFC